jgi:hypothetical protein
MAFEKGRSLNKIAFDVAEFEGRAQTLEPIVDGVPLTKLVADFQQAHDYTPAGEYIGIASCSRTEVFAIPRRPFLAEVTRL